MNKKITLLGLLVVSVFSHGSFAAPALWTDSESTSSLSARPDSIVLESREVELNVFALNILLTSRPELSARSNTINPVITIPLPQGGEVRVRAEEVSVMAPELAAQFPQIKTWRVIGEDDLNIHGRIDQTEHGFHAMLKMPDGDTVFIEPDKNASDTQISNKYLSFSKRSNLGSFKTDFQCRIHSDSATSSNTFQSFLSKKDEGLSSKLSARQALSKRTYRLAVAATGEYTQFHGGTKSKALSAIVTTINRVNGIYERDLSVSLQLIPEQMNIIYTNPSTDPYSNPNNSDALDAIVEENSLNLSGGDLTTNKFDIGHVFGAGSNLGGVAFVAGVCSNENKALGVTGSTSPIGDAFNIDFVAHEMGHQLGATHTFNSSCGGNRVANTAVEPGSGSTLMSYAGICGINDFQDAVDSQFHAVSILQISRNVRSGTGNSCGTSRSVSNENPEVNAGSDATIPSQTPFMLIASGTDSNRDALSYTWEQSDTGTASDLNVDTGDNAIFRSRPASRSRIRYIPRLRELFAGHSIDGERLPSEDRDVTFFATVRDGKGGIQIDSKLIKVASTGRPFSVTSHQFNETLSLGDVTTVTWDVAGTSSSPINCSEVDIYLVDSSGKGKHLTRTANDGRLTIKLADNTPEMSNARFMVACSTKPFFNISSAGLTIKGIKGGKLVEVVTGDRPTNTIDDDSGGGSIRYLLLPLLFLGIIRRKIKFIKV